MSMLTIETHCYEEWRSKQVNTYGSLIKTWNWRLKKEKKVQVQDNVPTYMKCSDNTTTKDSKYSTRQITPKNGGYNLSRLNLSFNINVWGAERKRVFNRVFLFLSRPQKICQNNWEWNECVLRVTIVGVRWRTAVVIVPKWWPSWFRTENLSTLAFVFGPVRAQSPNRGSARSRRRTIRTTRTRVYTWNDQKKTTGNRPIRFTWTVTMFGQRPAAATAVHRQWSAAGGSRADGRHLRAKKRPFSSVSPADGDRKPNSGADAKNRSFRRVRPNSVAIITAPSTRSDEEWEFCRVFSLSRDPYHTYHTVDNTKLRPYFAFVWVLYFGAV